MTIDRNKQDFSFEFFPPKNEQGEERLQKTLECLIPLKPDYVSVTFGAGGSTRERTFATVDKIQATTGIEAAPHLSCIGSHRDEIHAILERYRANGIKRIVTLRGDVPEQGEAFKAGGFRHANELVAFVKEFGGFEIAVGAYPEFHPETPIPAQDIANFVRKVKAGADKAITQYFFNNEAYYRFVDEVQRQGVDIPIIVGLMPIANFEQIDRFSKLCGADIPRWLRLRMEAFGDDTRAQQQLGIEIATRQAEALLANGAPGIHFYTLNRGLPTAAVWRNLGLYGA